MMATLRRAHVRSRCSHRPLWTSAWPSSALAKRLGCTALNPSDGGHHHVDVMPGHAGMSRQCEHASGDFSSAGAGFLITCQIRLDAGNISDRGRIRLARGDSGVPELAEHVRAIGSVPDQNGKAEVDRAASFDGPRELDALHSLDAGAKHLGVMPANLVVRLDAGKELGG